jgi:integrase
VAKRVIDARRDRHPEFVFMASKGKPPKPIKYMNNTACQKTRKDAGLSLVRVHDLKHTFGRRLRNAGVSLETRKVLLGHKNGDITSHYSAPELAELISAANAVFGSRPLLRVVSKQTKDIVQGQKVAQNSRKPIKREKAGYARRARPRNAA